MLALVEFDHYIQQHDLTCLFLSFKGSVYFFQGHVAALKTNIAAGQGLFLSHLCLYFFYFCVE
jgi:hypothetical protein